jgi:hypothetical protein
LPEATPLKTHFDAVVKAIYDRRVIPFLGAGASIYDQPKIEEWDPKRDEQIIPSNEDLTKHLARCYMYPEKDSMQLARVSQYAAVMHGVRPLYDTLQEIFDRDYQPKELHRFFAGLPKFYRDNNLTQPSNDLRRRLIMVTTNYDDLLEKAFEEAGEPYHKLVYMAATESKNESYLGRFLHWTPDGEHLLIRGENDQDSLAAYEDAREVERYPVIIKIHGAVDRDHSTGQHGRGAEYPSYVITEDHYIDYLTGADFFDLLPKSLSAALQRNNFLFLGYGLRDWNLRVILRRIWKDQQTLYYSSWAVQVETDDLDEMYWLKQNVKIVNMDLGEYIRMLKQYMDNYGV